MWCVVGHVRCINGICLSVMLQILGYLVQGLICLIYMPLCFQLARFTAEAASRVYADLTKDIDAGEVPDIAHADVPAVSTLFYNLPVRSSCCAVTQHQSCFLTRSFGWLMFDVNYSCAYLFLWSGCRQMPR